MKESALSLLAAHLQTGEAITEENEERINALASGIPALSAAEVLPELKIIATAPNIGELMVRFLPVFTALIPDYVPTVGYDQHTVWHAYDLYTHITHVVQGVPNDFALRIAAMLHDNGKPGSVSIEYKENGGYVYHFYGHHALSAKMAAPVLPRLGITGDLAKEILFLIEYHDYTISPTEHSVRKFLKQLNAQNFAEPMKVLEKLLALQTADHADHTKLVPIPSEEILSLAHKIAL